jgi:hypothetical protein
MSAHSQVHLSSSSILDPWSLLHAAPTTTVSLARCWCPSKTEAWAMLRGHYDRLRYQIGATSR